MQSLQLSLRDGPAPSSLARAMTPLLCRWLREDAGQDLVEYVLLGAAIAFAGLVVMNGFRNVISIVYASWDLSTQAIWEPQNPAP